MNQEKSYTIGVFILGDYTKNFETLMELGQSLRPFNIRLYKEYSENKQFVADSIEAGYNEQFDDGRTTGKLLHICPATENILKDIDNFFGYKNGNPVDGVIFGSDFKYSKDRINLKIAALHVYNENGLAGNSAAATAIVLPDKIEMNNAHIINFFLDILLPE